MAEKHYQRKLKTDAERLGWTVIKIIRATVNGYPDLLLMHPDRGVIWIEVKDDNGRLSKVQEYRINELREKGFTALVAYPDNYEFILRSITP
jgi:Holliday junction resolvase